jgi:hypothetical protein
MDTIINLRGTSGSGKSTVVRRVMEAAGVPAQPLTRDGRRRPYGYLVPRPSGLPVFIPGHYETACGGCDTLKTVDEVYALVRAAWQVQQDVLYEGIMVQDDVRRAVGLDRELRGRGGQLHVILLTTPIEECLAAVRSRREARGDARLLNEKNTRDRARRQLGIRDRLRAGGVEVEELDREAALARCCALLRLAPVAS